MTDPDAIGNIISFFKSRSALVAAAVAALEAMPPLLVEIGHALRAGEGSEALPRMAALHDIIRSAAFDGDNLLIASESDTFVLCGMSRRATGAFTVQTIDLDRKLLALASPQADGNRCFDILASEIRSLREDPTPQAIRAAKDAVATMSIRVSAALSRLSLLKARLGLQENFLTAFKEQEVGSPAICLESHFNEDGVRDMALAAKRLLNAGSFNLASGNRKTLTQLFEPYLSKAPRAAG